VRRLWLRWALLIAFVAVLGVAFISLGNWQLDRLAERKERNATTIANEQKPVQPYEQVFTHPITDADQWQRVEARGTFDADHQLIVRYRSNRGVDGYEVVTPLRTASGVVLVDRGFIPLERGTRIPSLAPAPPAGEVTVVGHVRRNEKGRRTATTPVGNQMRLINSDAIAETLPYEIKSGYIGLLTVQPQQQGGFQPMQLPELSEGPHFWYAVQWFMFTTVAAAGIVVFIRGDLRARREAHEAAAEGARDSVRI
jgi:cytochrome oxidase assembly protein ShyY1